MATRKGKRQSNFGNKKKQAIKRSRSARRQAHFESGRSLQEWNPGSKAHKNKRDKRQTRTTRKKAAIRDSMDG